MNKSTLIIVMLSMFLAITIFLIFTFQYERVEFNKCLLDSNWIVDKQEVEKVSSDDNGYKLLQWRYKLVCEDNPDIVFEYREQRPNWYLVSSKLRFNIQVIDRPEIPKPGEQ